MKPVVATFPGYPTFLWITRCKILFIPSDQNWKTFGLPNNSVDE
ncbi:hypothetical protein [Mangrovibacter phragmitis]